MIYDDLILFSFGGHPCPFPYINTLSKDPEKSRFALTRLSLSLSTHPLFEQVQRQVTCYFWHSSQRQRDPIFMQIKSRLRAAETQIQRAAAVGGARERERVRESKIKTQGRECYPMEVCVQITQRSSELSERGMCE